MQDGAINMSMVFKIYILNKLTIYLNIYTTHLLVKKIYIDSRYRTADGDSDSNFKIQLGRNIYLPERCVMRIDHCVIPHSWYTIEHDMNDKMYFAMFTRTS